MRLIVNALVALRLRRAPLAHLVELEDYTVGLIGRTNAMLEGR